jgi:hypothetical protein
MCHITTGTIEGISPNTHFNLETGNITMTNFKQIIDRAIELLTSHANEDFISKKSASDCASDLKNLLESTCIIDDILTEVNRAELKHPNWPVDKVYAATIVAEENGELTRAALQYEAEGGILSEIRTEAIHTAATCIRLIKNL